MCDTISCMVEDDGELPQDELETEGF